MALSSASVYPTIAVSDLDRSRKFYEETLGFSASSVRPDGVIYEAAGGTKYLVYPSSFAGTAQSTYMAFEVTDFDRTLEELRGKGITFEEYDFPGLKTVNGVAELEGLGKAAWFKDPDGNILSIGEPPA